MNECEGNNCSTLPAGKNIGLVRGPDSKRARRDKDEEGSASAKEVWAVGDR